VPGVPRGEPLALEDVPKVSTATSALDLHPLTVRVGESPNGPGYLLVERGPSAMRLELVLRTVEGCPTLLALVNPRLKVVLILARERRFGTFVENDLLLGPRQRAKRGFVRIGHAKTDPRASYNVMAREDPKLAETPSRSEGGRPKPAAPK